MATTTNPIGPRPGERPPLVGPFTRPTAPARTPGLGPRPGEGAPPLTPPVRDPGLGRRPGEPLKP